MDQKIKPIGQKHSIKMDQKKNAVATDLPQDIQTKVIGRIGTLETRLARDEQEIHAAQRLRYKVFYEELGATIPSQAQHQRDQDQFDPFCDHILVVETAGGVTNIVGTYRLLTQSKAEEVGGFYTQSEFDIANLLSANPQSEFLELGRSCILPEYRNKRTMELLWHGAWSYALSQRADIMFGCASFEGTDSKLHRPAFSWLAQNALLPEAEDCPALLSSKVNLNSSEPVEDSPRQIMAALPPLLKGYLRLGAKVGSQAVIDHQFGTTDILVVLKVDQINPRYIAHYGKDASRFAV